MQLRSGAYCHRLLRLRALAQSCDSHDPNQFASAPAPYRRRRCICVWSLRRRHWWRHRANHLGSISCAIATTAPSGKDPSCRPSFPETAVHFTGRSCRRQPRKVLHKPRPGAVHDGPVCDASERKLLLNGISLPCRMRPLHHLSVASYVLRLRLTARVTGARHFERTRPRMCGRPLELRGVGRNRRVRPSRTVHEQELQGLVPCVQRRQAATQKATHTLPVASASRR